jgi:hypothetical protein
MGATIETRSRCGLLLGRRPIRETGPIRVSGANQGPFRSADRGQKSVKMKDQGTIRQLGGIRRGSGQSESEKPIRQQPTNESGAGQRSVGRLEHSEPFRESADIEE